MKKKLLFISVIAALSIMATGCDVDVDVDNSNADVKVSDTAPATEAAESTSADENKIQETSETEKAAEETKATEKPAEDNSAEKAESTVTEAVKEEAVGQNERTAYAHPEDVKCDGAEVWKNADGTLSLTFENGKFSMTVPSTWEDHFIIDGTIIRSKIASRTDGKLISFSFEDGKTDQMSWHKVIRGFSGNTFWFSYPVTDVRYNMDNEEEAEEYKLLSKTLGSAVYESKNAETGLMEKIFSVPDGMATGMVENLNETIYGYTDDYVNGLVSEADGRNWTIENDWKVTIRKVMISPVAGTMYDCYDSEDGDHYGWISANSIKDLYK